MNDSFFTYTLYNHPHGRSWKIETSYWRLLEIEPNFIVLHIRVFPLQETLTSLARTYIIKRLMNWPMEWCYMLKCAIKLSLSTERGGSHLLLEPIHIKRNDRCVRPHENKRLSSRSGLKDTKWSFPVSPVARVVHFHAFHGNNKLLSSAAFDLKAQLAAARAIMRNQVSIDGEAYGRRLTHF